MTQETRQPDASLSQLPDNSTVQPLNNVTSIGTRFLRYWLPVLCWVALIFFLSSIQGSSLSDFGSLDFFVKKGAHITEYAILYLLIFRAIGTLVVPRKALVIAAIVSVLYAISDEYHQTFVPLREGTARDVVIDSIGAFLMYLFLHRRHGRRPIPSG